MTGSENHMGEKDALAALLSSIAYATCPTSDRLAEQVIAGGWRQPQIEQIMEVLNTHRWESMGVSSVSCECGEICYGDESLTQFPADEAFRRHVAEQVYSSEEGRS